jgi:hypothetical protein
MDVRYMTDAVIHHIKGMDCDFFWCWRAIDKG